MHQTIQNNVELPQELCAKPLALVGVSGLDTVNNAIHKSIWETFSNNRRIERAPVLFKLIGNAHEFPVIKPKRNSYDWYIPKGILKRNWMNKHSYEIPAVIVIFYDLDWDDSLWNEKMIECASRVQSMRAALEGRNTRLVVVLIQNKPPLPAGEDVQASDRAVTLCASCELNANSLFVLPHGDHLQGYAIRLENAFYEFAQNYYHGEIKLVRSHKDHLNKSTHQYLFVRHQFKMGFLYELKQDIHNAHKHYTHAYNNLLEIRIVDTNALEIRTIAGYINYKLCRLMFTLNLPRDAISQFKAHIDRFKNRIGFHELAFEHYAWLSKQFAIFGDVFDEAVKLGLPAVQTQHPGIYYQQAAQYAIQRKKSCQELCLNATTYPDPDPLEGSSHMEYFGQRPWRPGKLTAEPPDPQLEFSGIQSLQFLEKQVQHSSIIIALYGLAIAQYKTYRCPRTRRHLVLQMADEYYNSQDFGKALTLLTHMLWDFRAEGWWSLLSDILEKAIKCAFLTANIQDYILLALEILSNFTKINDEQKKKIYENLQRILTKQIPFGDQELTQDALKSAISQWQTVINQTQNYLLDMSNITACIETKARFLKNKYEVDQRVAVEIFVRSTCPYSLTFTRISVNISTTTTNSEFVVNGTNFTFQSGEIQRFVVDFVTDPNDLQKEVQISSVNLLMGTFNLKFPPSYLNRISPELLHFKYTKNQFDFDNISSLISTQIVPRNSKLQIKYEHNPPILLGEWYQIKIDIINEEQFKITNLTISIDLFDDEMGGGIEFSKTSAGIPEKIPLLLEVTSELVAKEKSFTKFYLRAYKIGNRSVSCKFAYNLNGNQSIISVKDEIIPITIVKPFEINTKFLSSLMCELNKFYVGEEIVVMPQLTCLSPIPIQIENTQFEFYLPMEGIETNLTSKLKDLKLNNNEIAAELFLAKCEKASDQNINVGQYCVKWRRHEGFTTTSQLTVIGCIAEWVPLELNVTVPAHGLVRTPLLILYHLRNKSQQLLQLDVSMEASEAFMYAGYKQFSVSILPETTKTIQYNLYPLVAGSVALPKLLLTVPENSTEGPALRQDQLKFLVERSLPTHLYVMPQAKGNPKLPDIVKPRKLPVI